MILTETAAVATRMQGRTTHTTHERFLGRTVPHVVRWCWVACCSIAVALKLFPPTLCLLPQPVSVRELRQAAHAARQRQALEEAAEKAAQVQLVRAKTAEGRARQRKASLEERRAAATRNVQEKLKLDVKLRVRFVTLCNPKHSLAHTHTLCSN